jgi:hypothetical protein
MKHPTEDWLIDLGYVRMLECLSGWGYAMRGKRCLRELRRDDESLGRWKVWLWWKALYEILVWV